MVLNRLKLEKLGLTRELLPRFNWRHLAPDLVVVVVSAYLSLYLRVGNAGFREDVRVLNRLLPIFVFIILGTLQVMGVYKMFWRFISVKDAVRLFKAICLSSLLFIATTYFLDIGHLPRSVFFINAAMLMVALGGIRVLRRIAYEGSSTKALEQSGRHTLIYGAGVNGRNLVNRLTTDKNLGLCVIGFIDDDPQKMSKSICGVRVLGTQKDLKELVERYSIRELIITVSRPKPEFLRQVLQLSHQLGIKAKLVGDLIRTVNTTSRLDMFRSIELSDLLNRKKRVIDCSSIRSMIQNKRVLITGAGGSIGSEIARQVSQHNPARLLLLDHSEYNLYEIDKELRPSFDDVRSVTPLLVDIKDKTALAHVFREFQPEIVFHAAAYKHVHLVEFNPASAVLNNILGTRNLVSLSEQHGVETFLMISTDKAVNPVGVMGATKFICELLVTHAAKRTKKAFSSVRFGNVLGSSGSLIPLLQKQIQNLEPLTITHPDMTRFFMLIPEAVFLVLKSAAMAEPGDISILKMGSPIRVVDIAECLIELMGKDRKSIPIVFTGLRPGEKMHEELYFSGDELNTEDEDILVLPHKSQRLFSSQEELDTQIDSLVQSAATALPDVAMRLHNLVRNVQTESQPQQQTDPKRKPEKSSPLYFN